MYEIVLEKSRIIFGAEMDGIDQKVPIDKDSVDLNLFDFIELKVTRHITHPRQNQTFYRFKMLKWWCQSFLVGIQRVIVGYRNDNGIVNEIKEMPVKLMPKLAVNYWSPAVCMRFLSDFLNTVKTDMMNVNDVKIVYKYDWDPKLQEFIKRTEFNNVEKYLFLPERYIKVIQSNVIKTTNQD